MRLLIITSVEAEARAIGAIENASIVVGGIGRTNAAAATTEAIIRAWNRGSGAGFDAVISAGIAGALPNSDLQLGDTLVASRCIYAEEGLITSKGFATLQAIGFSLGDFEGNAVPVDEELLDALSGGFAIGPIATVATCSGTNEAAAEVARRCGGALAEAMEGAAVVHAARRLKVSAIEIRTISNTCGDRASQQWDISRALEALTTAIPKACELVRKTATDSFGASSARSF